VAAGGANAGRDGRRVTIYDVARAAGVSSGTVSRVLNGRQGVSASARKAVEQALAGTGYVPNYHARRLAGARAETVAFLHCVGADQLFADANINGLMLGCGRALGDHDIMQVVPVNPGASEATFRQASGVVDAALVFSAPARSGVLADLVERGLPLVTCGAPTGQESAVSYVTGDDRDGARQVVSYLRSRGRRRIATVTGPLELASGAQRLAGYRDALESFDPALVTNGDYSSAGGAAAVGRLLRQAPDLDALFVASDAMAAGALATLEQAGRRVPEDVAVAGFDDAAIAAALRPQLTTVRVPWPRIADELVRQLLRRIDGDGPSGVIMPVELALRGSA
jgi:DNA-binding LacI/PurR family transcriptional regulator